MKRLIYYATVIGSAGLVWGAVASASTINTTRSNIKSLSVVITNLHSGNVTNTGSGSATSGSVSNTTVIVNSIAINENGVR